MAELPTASEVANLASLLAPGLIILSIRSRFVSATIPDIKDKIVAYAVVSAAYVAATNPLFNVSWGVPLPDWLWRFQQFFALPVLLGLMAAYVHQLELSYWVARKIRLRLFHHMPAAWDFAFSKILKGTYVLVRLNDGTQVAGKMGRRSFASSAREERDLLIEEIWRVKDEGSWELVEPRRAMLLCGRDIKLVEIFERSQ